MNRDEAWALLTEYTASDSLRKHALGVEAAMRHYADVFEEDAEQWGLVGLLHDFDYERWPDPPDHTRAGAEVLRQRGVDEVVVGAILSHAEWNLETHPRDCRLRQTLFAVDELVGFTIAVALMRPDRLTGMGASSVRKKMKQKSFAAAVKREDIAGGAEALGLSLTEHIDHVIAALTRIRDALGV